MFVFGKLVELLQLNSFIPGFGLAFKSDLLGLESGLDLWLCLYPQQHYFSQCFGQKSVLCVCNLNAHIRTHTLAGHTITARTQPYIYFFCVLCRSAALVARYADWILCRPHQKVVHTHTHMGLHGYTRTLLRHLR